MLREVSFDDVMVDMEEPVYFLMDDVLYSPEEIRERVRVLVDEDEEEEEMPDEELIQELIEKPRRSTDEIRTLIKAAVNAGCTRRSEICDYCDITGPTADRHKDLWKKGE